MPLTLEQTTSDALSLADEERAQLAHILISSVDFEGEDFSAEWDVEVARRVKEIDSGQAQGRPAANVVRDIRARYA